MDAMPYLCRYCCEKRIKTVVRRKATHCPRCKNTLYADDLIRIESREDKGKTKCPTCKGTGKVTVWRVAGNIPITESPCQECNGKGWIKC